MCESWLSSRWPEVQDIRPKASAIMSGVFSVFIIVPVNVIVFVAL